MGGPVGRAAFRISALVRRVRRGWRALPAGSLSMHTLGALEILMLVGFSTGAVLHLYIARLIARREELWGPEPTFVVLGTVLGFWHVGNLLSAFPVILGIDHITVFLRVAYTLAFGSLACLPATL